MIRPATIDDLSELGKIYVEIQAYHASLYPDIFKQANIIELRNHMAHLLRTREYRIIVAETDAIIVGYAVLKIIENPGNAILYPFRMAVMDQIVVKNKLRKHGIGKSLLDGMIQIANDEKVDRIILDVWAKNKTAQDFYRSNGFTLSQEWLVYTG